MPHVVALLVVFAIGVMMCRPAVAQGRADDDESFQERKYENLPVDDALSKKEFKARAFLREGKLASAQEKEDFDNFYKNYFLSRWSLQTDVRHLAAHRQELLNHFRNSRSPEVHDYLNELVFDFMKTLVAGDFHPAVKVNAMLMIGELNRVEQTGHDAAVPLPEALTALIAAAGKANLPDGLRVAAMIGILRHADAGIKDDDTRKSLTTVMLRLVAADLPAGSAPTGRAWLVVQAAETLGKLGSVGDGNAVFQALLKRVGDSKLPFLVRSAAANSLGQLDYSSATGINPVETAATVGQFALDACVEELRLAKESKKPVSRRRMLQRLNAALMVLGEEDDKDRKGITPLAKEPAQQAFLAGLQKPVKAARDVLDYKREEAADMKPHLVELQKKLDASLQKKP